MRTLLSTYTVTSLVNAPGSSDKVALRYAINQANANPGSTINFSVTGTIALNAGLPELTTTVTIVGPGASSLTVDGEGRYIFIIAVSSTATASISGLTLKGGHSGVYNAGHLSVMDTTITDNVAVGDIGGGIQNTLGGVLTLFDSTISGNFAMDGGGIYNDAGGTVMIEGCTISGNGNYNIPSGIDIDSVAGGGIYNFGTTTIENSTIADNSAFETGGGIFNKLSLSVTNCTISGNVADFGGGIYSNIIVPSSRLGDGLPFVNLGNSIVAANTSNFPNSNTNSPDLHGAFASLGRNLIGDIAGGELYGDRGSFGHGDGDLFGIPTNRVDPMLGPLADNGGPTQTMALLPGAWEIDKGLNDLGSFSELFVPDLPLYDQRGPNFSRIVDGKVDEGAFEVQPPVAPSITLQPISQAVAAGGSVTFSTAANGYTEPAPSDFTATNLHWYVKAPGSGFQLIPDADGSIFTLIDVNAGMNGNIYEAIFTNFSGSATTDGALLTVISPPTITLQPRSQTVAAGESVTFTTAATGYPDPAEGGFPAATVHWYVNALNTGFQLIPDADDPVLTLNDVNAGMNGNRYEALFTNSAGSVQTAAALLTVISPPTANSQNDDVTYNTPTDITLTGSDPNSPTRTLSYKVAVGPLHGMLNGTAPNLVYTPNQGYVGPDSFTFTVNNATLTSPVATVTLDVAAGVPTAYPQSVNVAFNTPAAIKLTASDPDSQPLPLLYFVFMRPKHGTLSGTPPHLTYTPNTGYQGPDSFGFWVNNGVNSSTPVAVTIAVAAGVPTADSKSVNVSENSSVGVTLTGSDPDVPALPLTYLIRTSPSHGTLSGTAPNLTYIPKPGYQGADSFTFTASNAFNTGTPATVAIKISPVSTAVSGDVSVAWNSTSLVMLHTNVDGLRLLPTGRNTDLPWLGINKLKITLSQAQTLSPSDISVTGLNVRSYGPVTVSGSGTSYSITLARPINAADRVTVTIGNAGIPTFTRRLDVLPGDFNDDGVVTMQDAILIRNEYIGIAGAIPTISGDINGDGIVDLNDYNATRKLLGSHLP